MDDYRKQNFLSDLGGMLAKVVGGGLVLLFMGLLRHADDFGRAAARAGSHAGAPIEQAARGGADETWRVVRTETTAPVGTDDGFSITRTTINTIEQADTAAPVEQETAREGANESGETILGRASEFTLDVVEEAAGEVAQEGAENLIQEGIEQISDKDKDEERTY